MNVYFVKSELELACEDQDSLFSKIVFAESEERAKEIFYDSEKCLLQVIDVELIMKDLDVKEGGMKLSTMMRLNENILEELRENILKGGFKNKNNNVI